jgi:hypothetical protein
MLEDTESVIRSRRNKTNNTMAERKSANTDLQNSMYREC